MHSQLTCEVILYFIFHILYCISMNRLLYFMSCLLCISLLVQMSWALSFLKLTKNHCMCLHVCTSSSTHSLANMQTDVMSH